MRAIEHLEYILNTSRKMDTNHQIAEQLLQNLPELHTLSAEEVANRCNVSGSTLARFFKANGYGTYMMFLGAIQVAISDYKYRSVYVPSSAKSDKPEVEQLFDALEQNVASLRQNVSITLLEEACRAMHESERVVFVSSSPMTGLNLTVLRTALALTHCKTELLEPFAPLNVEALKLSKKDFVFLIKVESPSADLLDNVIRAARKAESKTLAISNVLKFSGWEQINYPLSFKGYQAYADLFAIEAIFAMLSTTYRRLFWKEISAVGQ